MISFLIIDKFKEAFLALFHIGIAEFEQIVQLFKSAADPRDLGFLGREAENGFLFLCKTLYQFDLSVVVDMSYRVVLGDLRALRIHDLHQLNDRLLGRFADIVLRFGRNDEELLTAILNGLFDRDHLCYAAVKILFVTIFDELAQDR